MEAVSITDSGFVGRVDMYAVECDASSCRGLVQSTITAEGPSGLLHGGAATVACLNVLSSCQDLALLGSYRVAFKRPIPLLQEFVVECKRLGLVKKGVPQQWKCQVLDRKRNLLQESVATFLDHAKRSVL
jgi:hypothetical protein